MPNKEEVYKIELDGSFTIDRVYSFDKVHFINMPKKLITGFMIVDAEYQLKENESLKCVLQFQKEQLRYCILYAPYQEFLENPERWDQPTIDGSIEKEACRKWAGVYLDLIEGENYEWGSIQIIYEQWVGKASIMFLYNK